MTQAPFRPFSGPSPLAFVLQENLRRRHLTATQKATLAVVVLPWEEKEARERQIRLAGTRPNSTPDLGEKIPQGRAPKSSEKAAAKVGANPRYVSDAKRIALEAPDLFEKMKMDRHIRALEANMAGCPAVERGRAYDRLVRTLEGLTDGTTWGTFTLPQQDAFLAGFAALMAAVDAAGPQGREAEYGQTT